MAFHTSNSVNFETLSQNLSTGTGSFNLSFWLEYSGQAPAEFKVLFDGATVLDKNDFSTNNGLYKFFSLSVTSSHSIAPLEFDFNNHINYFNLDDVSVTAATATPVPSSITMLCSLAITVAGCCGWRRRKQVVIA